MAKAQAETPQGFKRIELNKLTVVDFTSDQNIVSNLFLIFKIAFWTYHESSMITKYRRIIQGDPKFVRVLAVNLKDLKKLYKKNMINGKFTFESALALFEIDGTEFFESKKDKSVSMKDSKGKKK